MQTLSIILINFETHELNDFEFGMKLDGFTFITPMVMERQRIIHTI